MPLPTTSTEWPPRDCQKANGFYDLWGAWYSGDPGKLEEVYGGTAQVTPGPDLKAYDQVRTGGVSGWLSRQARKFWGQPASVGEHTSRKLHIPLAGDIAATSADLLFGEQPRITVGEGKERDAKTQGRIEEMRDEGGAGAVLHEAAEIQSPYGGVYVRVTVDPTLSDYPIFDAIPPDSAVPEWRAGRLVAVTFWRTLAAPDHRCWRHLERHEPGRIYHGLYASRSDGKLGQAMSLADHPDTARWAEAVNVEGFIETGAVRMAVEYVPNMRPNRIMRGSPLGRSDYSGVEPIFDALDESWTSWLRDLRLGKGRLIVPNSYLQSMGRGAGAYFDADREVFQGVEALTAPGSMALEVVQFEIRVQQHQETCTAITAQALRGAGYSTQTFGEQGEVAATATEVVARERRSYTTRARKINYWKPALRRLWETALQMDAKQFRKDGVTAQPPNIEWPDGVSIDPESTGRTLQLIHAAEAASLKTKVAMLHPEWDDDQVKAEVIQIREEMGSGKPPEETLGGLAGNQPADPAAEDLAAEGDQPAEGQPAPPGAATSTAPPARPAQRVPTPPTR